MKEKDLGSTFSDLGRFSEPALLMNGCCAPDGLERKDALR